VDTTWVGLVAELTSRAEELGMASRAIWLITSQLNSTRLLLDRLHLTYQLVMLHQASRVEPFPALRALEAQLVVHLSESGGAASAHCSLFTLHRSLFTDDFSAFAARPRSSNTPCTHVRRTHLAARSHHLLGMVYSLPTSRTGRCASNLHIVTPISHLIQATRNGSMQIVTMRRLSCETGL
jgi:hypothetical protein